MQTIDSFKNRLARALEIKNLKPVELHEKTGLSESLISKYLSGVAVPRQRKIDILSNALEVNPVWLMGYDVPMESIPIKKIDKIKIPVLGKVKAGYDYLAQENVIGYESIDNVSDPENYYALQVSGDSMKPLFSDGDIAIVHRQDDFDSGNTCIILVNGDEATVKKVIKTDDGIDLIAMNPYYPVRHFTRNEMNEIPVKVIGKVVEARKRKIFE